MKFSFDKKEKEDSFIKTRTESLALPVSTRDLLLKQGIRTVGGLVHKSNKELNKIAGSSANATRIVESLDKLALEIQFTEDKIKNDEAEERTESTEIGPSSSLTIPETIFNEDEDIIDSFAKYFGMDRDLIVSESRRQDIVHVRDLIVCVLREYAEMSFPAIGKLLGNRNHTTIIHSYRKLEDKFKSDWKLRSHLDELIIKAKAIKDRKIHIEEKLLPDLIAYVREKQLQKPFKAVEIPERNLKLLELYREGLTLEELGKSSGVTRERARQIVDKTIRQMAINESVTREIELDTNIILEEEKKKRLIAKIKRKGPVLPKPVKEKTWSKYYLACRSCGTTSVPHKRRGWCENCLGQYGKKKRDEIIKRHSDICDNCKISRNDAFREYGRDFYITKSLEVFCRKCFARSNGKTLGTRTRNKVEA